MSKNLEKMLRLYDELNEDEKIRLFLSLDQKDMREHYDPSYRRYRIKAVNFYGKLLADATIPYKIYNLREARKISLNLLNDSWKIYKYEPIRESYMSKEEIVRYRDRSYVKLDIIQE